MDLSELRALGLSEGEIRVYKAILDLGNTAINAIHEKTTIERRNIYDIINKLIGKGYISFTIEKGKRTYQCTSPNILRDQIKKKQLELKKIGDKIPDIQKLINATRPNISAEIYRGNDGIKSILHEVLSHKKSYWLGGNSFENYKSIPKGVELWFSSWMKKRVENKHVMYDLVDHGTYLKGLKPSDTKAHKKQYYHYCTLPKGFNSPMVILIFGNKVAQILWGQQSFAFVLESEKIKKSYMEYFNHFWKGPK